MAAFAMPVALIAFAMLIMTDTGADDGRGSKMSEPSQAEVADFIGAALPADAQELHVFTERGIDQIMYVAFFASPEAVEAFLKALAIEKPIREGYNPLRETSRDDLPWWTVATMTDPVGLKESRYQPESKAYEIAIDRVTPTSWHIFLLVFEA